MSARFRMSQAGLAGIVLAVLVSASVPVSAVGPAPWAVDPVTNTFLTTGEPVPNFYEEPAPLELAKTRGARHILVIMAYANDRPTTYTTADFESSLFSEGEVPSGSMREYYLENSYGQYDLTGDVVGWYELPYEYAHYHQNSYGLQGGGQLFAVDAVNAADAAGVDFSVYDDDGDGVVESVIIIHQGPDGATTGNPGCLWSHMGWFPSETVIDGVTLRNYNCDPETQSGTNKQESIGVFAHEYGHSLGMSDLYQNGSLPEPVGKWCIMASGSYNGTVQWPGSVPSHFSAYQKILVGWLEPTELAAPQTGISVAAVQNHSGSNVIYKLVVNSDPEEYFLLENRWIDHPGMFDHNGLPDQGLIIYHVDENIAGGPQTGDPFWWVDIENPTSYPHRNYAPFGGGPGETEWTRTSTPASSAGHYLPSGIDVTNISTAGETMQFDLNLFPTFDYDHLDLSRVNDTDFDLVVHTRNRGHDAVTVAAHLVSNSPNLQILTGDAPLADAPRGTLVSNENNPFRFRVLASAGRDEQTTLELTVTADRGYVSHVVPVLMVMNPSEILFVDDDQDMKNRPQDDELNYLAALDAIGAEYYYWENATDGLVFESPVLALYDIVIWNCGFLASGSLKAEEMNRLKGYLNRGGRLFLNAQELLYQERPSNDWETDPEYDYVPLEPGMFSYDYLKVRMVEHDEYYYEVHGVAGDPITAGMDFTISDPYSDDPTGASIGDFDYWPDNFTVDPSAAPIFTSGPHYYFPGHDPELEDDTSDLIPLGPCALRYPASGPSTYRVVFFAFPFEGLDDGTTTRAQLMTNILDWLRTGETVETGVRLELPAMAHPGEEFYVKGHLINAGAPIVEAPVFFILEVYGEFWFWPGWKHYAPPTYTEIDFRMMAVPTGSTEVSVIPAFPWPDTGADTITGLYFYGAMLNDTMTDLRGLIGVESWGYGPAE